VRIQIIGASGSGKSTLGKLLSERLGIPLLESDRYYWADADFRVSRSDNEKRHMLFADLARYRCFVFTGAPQSWARGYPKELDLLVFLRLDDQVRMDRLRAREIERFGERAMPGGDHFSETTSFLSWAATYETSVETEGNTLVAHRRLISEMACPVLQLDSSQGVNLLVEVVLKALVS
jgi:adenylate kinase family enzyme